MNVTKKPDLQDDYFWSISGEGTAHPDHSGEPNHVIAAWDFTLHIMDDDGEKQEPPLCKIPLSVVDQGTAVNLGEDLHDVFDAEGGLPFDYYEHAKESDDAELELFVATRVVIVNSVDLTSLPPDRLLDVVEILSRLFEGAIVAIYCYGSTGDRIADHLKKDLSSLPRLPGDEPNEQWLYHDSRYQLFPESDDVEKNS